MARRIGFGFDILGFGLHYYNETVDAAPQQPAIAATSSVPAIKPADANSAKSESSSSQENNTRSKLIAFYKNEIPSQPDGDFIENILNDWSGDYEKLDTFNFYIQWLFPGRNRGKNPEAPLLTDGDLEIMLSSQYKNRVMRAFAMMLDFYGMKLQNNTIELAPNYKERLQKISSHGKYYLVISRILSFLKELGEQKLMITWLKLLADLIQKKLLDENAKTSFNSYWIKTLDKKDFDDVKIYVREMNGK